MARSRAQRGMADPGRRAFLGRSVALGMSAPAFGGLVGACSADDDDAGFGDEAAEPDGGTERFEGRLVISTTQNPPEAAQQALTAAYNEQQPDVEIVWETRDFENPGAYTSWLGTQLSSGEIRPDIVSGNYVKTFTDYVNFDEHRSQDNPYTQNPWDEDLNFDHIRSSNAQGERIMVPTRAYHALWYYNKQLFDQVGVQPPTTWDELVEVCEALDAAGIIPISANYDYVVPQWLAEIYFDQYHVDWVELTRAQEGDWNFDPQVDGEFSFDPNDSNIHASYTYSPQRFLQAFRDGEIRFDTAEVAEIARNLARVFPRYATSDFFVITDHYSPFLQQNVAMLIDGVGSMPTLTSDLEALSPERLEELEIDPDSVDPFDWDVFPMPSMQGELVKVDQAKTVESSTGEYLSVVDKDQRTSEMAVDFCRFWASPAGYGPYLEAYAESDEFTASGPLLVQGVEDPPEVQELFDRIDFLGNAETSYNNFWVSGAGDEMRTDLHNMLRDALTGDVDPDDYAAGVQEYVTDNFDEILDLLSFTEEDIDNPARRPGSS